MISEIQHIISRCGGGKSVHTVIELHKHLAKDKNIPLVLFASKTNELTSQNYDRFNNEIRSNNSHVKSLRIDSTIKEGSVSDNLQMVLKDRFSGVVFISHAALSILNADLLNDIDIFLDEVPQELVRCLFVRNEAKDSGNVWERYITTTPSSHMHYQQVRLMPLVDVNEVERYASNILTGSDNSATRDVAELLMFLLKDYEVLYSTVTTKENRTFDLYQTVHWLKLQLIIENCKSLTILAAQLDKTLLGYVAKHKLKVNIEKYNITQNVQLEEKHKHKVRIIPFLKQGRWSGELKKAIAKDALLEQGNPIPFKGSVSDCMQYFISQIMKGSEYVFTCNRRDNITSALEATNYHQTTVAVHGMNHLREVHHAAYMASTRPTPFEIKALRMFAIDNAMDADDLVVATVTERCYEAAYQCIARTSIRCDSTQDLEHILIVPDMEYARYISSWFEDGNVNIDTSQSLTTVNSGALKQAYNNRRTVITNLLSQKRTKGTKVADLLVQYNISLSSYKRYRKEHTEHLKEVGLI